jgi:SAM-dependent methyltransferase
LADGNALGGFEALYERAGEDASAIPWADQAVNPNLVDWINENPGKVRGRVLVVGCGLGDDAEHLSQLGCEVTAFDISETAIRWCRSRFERSDVRYEVADLLALPADWSVGFDFVLESYTLQVLPEALQDRAIASMAECVAAKGTLLLITRGREPEEPEGAMPWPLTKSQCAQFTAHGLTESRFEEYWDREDPPVRRYRVEYRRASDVAPV